MKISLLFLGAAAILVPVSFQDAPFEVPQPPERIVTYQNIEAGEPVSWDEMARRGLACRALIRAAHRVDLATLEFTANAIVRIADGGMTQLEIRALEALGVDVGALTGMSWTEIELWRSVADPSRPATVGGFGSPGSPLGLGDTRWVEVIAQWPDDWSNHPDHPYHPDNMEAWVQEVMNQTDEEMNEMIDQNK